MTEEEGITTTYTYDALGRVIAETKSGGGIRSDTTISTTYDPEDRILSRTVTSGNLSETETYAYDALGRTITTAYDAEGRVLAQRGATYPVDYTYDAYGNKVSMTTYRNEDDIPVGGVVPNAPQTGDTTVGGVVPNAPHTGDTTRGRYP